MNPRRYYGFCLTRFRLWLFAAGKWLLALMTCLAHSEREKARIGVRESFGVFAEGLAALIAGESWLIVQPVLWLKVAEVAA